MNKKEWKEHMLNKGWPVSFEVNPWGSCQYDTIYKTYKLYFKIKKDLEKEFTGRKLIIETLNILNIKVKDKIILNDFQTIKNTFCIMLLEEVKDALTSKNYDYANIIISHVTNIVLNAKDGDYLFIKAREMSWDLWKTIPSIFNLSFMMDMDTTNVPTCPGIGPMANQIAQSNNYTLGIMAALLVEFNIINNEKSFTKFDT